MNMPLLAITLVLLVLIVAAYRLEIPKATGPLVIVYFLYLGFSILTQDTPIQNLSDIREVKPVPDTRPTIEKFSDQMAVPLVPDKPKSLVLDSVPITIPKPVKPVEVEIKNESDTESEAKPEKPIEQEPEITLILNEMLICRGIYKRSPIKPGREFSNKVDSLYCYTKISNSGKKQELQHIWYHNDREITRVRYNIKPSFNYRSWSKKTIYPENIGDWRVDVVDEDGDVLGSTSFIITVSSSEL